MNTTQTANAYQISYDYGNYSHSDVIDYGTDYDSLHKMFNDLVAETIAEKGEWHEETDCITLESIIATFDDEGNVEDIVDYIDVIEEHIFNDYEE